MVDHGYAETCEKAAALIMAGDVLINDQRVDKAGHLVSPDARVSVRTKSRYVSRGGLKLDQAAIRDLPIDVTGAVCADIGTSTGGFTDCLLQHGAKKVHCVDTGAGQIDWKLRGDPRVVLHEGFNARNLDSIRFMGEAVDLAVCDVSFISRHRDYSCDRPHL